MLIAYPEKLIQRLAASGKSVALPLLFALVALALRLAGLGSKSLWGDEALTAWHSTYSALALWTQPITNKPPLYYLLTALFWSPGDSEFLLRLPAALVGAMTVAGSWFLGRRLAGPTGAFWLALFMLLSDINLEYSQEARQYILLTFGWLLLVLAMMRLLMAAGNRLDRVGLLIWGLGALLMVQTHPVGLLYLAASQLAFWLALFVVPSVPRSYLIFPTIMTLVAALTIAPWLWSALGASASSFNWLHQPAPVQALLEWLSLFGARNLVHLGGAQLAVVASVLLAVCSMAGLMRYWYRHKARGTLLLGLALLPPLLLWLMGLVKPVYMLRTISPSHLLAMTGLAVAVASLSQVRKQILVGGLLVLVLATSSWSWRSYYQKEAWRGLSRQLHQQAGKGDWVVICESNLQRPLWFYLGKDLPGLLDLDRNRHRIMSWQPDERRWRGFHPAPGQNPPRTFWLVDRYHHCPGQIDRILYQFTGLRYRADASWMGRALTLTPWRLGQYPGLPGSFPDIRNR